MKGTDLVGLFTEHLRLCNVKKGEVILAFTDAQFAFPEYPGAMLAAARSLGAEAFAITSPSDAEISAQLVLDAWKSADMVIAMTTIPWLYTDAHNEALASGTRTLMVHEPVANLKRMFPNEDVIRRTYAGAKRMAEASEIRVTDSAGSDFTLRKDGRKGHAQVGLADQPGRWDHWPAGLVATGPLEDTAQGTYIVRAGDVILQQRRHTVSEIRMTLEKGLITSIEGGLDAQLLRDYLSSFDDPDAFRFAHAGWGTEHRSLWNVVGMDSESLYGTVMVSPGRNIFNAAHEHSGLGGTNYTKAHIDLCCRHKNLYLDGELIVNEDEEIVPEYLR